MNKVLDTVKKLCYNCEQSEQFSKSGEVWRATLQDGLKSLKPVKKPDLKCLPEGDNMNMYRYFISFTWLSDATSERKFGNDIMELTKPICSHAGIYEVESKLAKVFGNSVVLLFFQSI